MQAAAAKSKGPMKATDRVSTLLLMIVQLEFYHGSHMDWKKYENISSQIKVREF